MKQSDKTVNDTRSFDKQWLLTQCNSVIEPMMLKIYDLNPEDHIGYMLEHLEKKFGIEALNGTPGVLKTLQSQVKELEAKVKEQFNYQQEDSDRELKSEEDTDEDQDSDYLDDLPEPTPVQTKARGPRSSVSAEAFGNWNQRKAFTPKVYMKTPQQEAAIYEKLNLSFMFRELDEADKKIVVAAMEEKIVIAREKVISEGDEGDCLYVVGSGTLLCQKVFQGKSEPTFLKTYQPGEAFGELALLYNCPRAATIIANEESLLWKLDRDTFNHIVKDAANKKRAKYEKFLATAPILSTMEPYERSKLSDAFKEFKVSANDYIIKEGDSGNDLYLLLQGEAVATKALQAGTQQVMVYKSGDFFGERALIKNVPRAANVVAVTECVLLSLDRHSVKRLLGPLEELLKRNFEVYEQFK